MNVPFSWLYAAERDIRLPVPLPRWVGDNACVSGGTGVAGVLRNGDGPTVMLRAGVNALVGAARYVLGTVG